MKKTYLKEVLQKYREGSISEEERKFLFSYYELFDAEPDVMAEMTSQQKSELKYDIHDAINRRIATDEKVKHNIRYMPLFRRIAAAVVIIFFSTLGFMYLLRQDNPATKSQVAAAQKKEHRLIHLPDGSIVVVSAGSKLDYPQSFETLASREVYLDGEAFFDIKHDSAKPFIVHTGKLQTTVLGTAFNVKAWASEADISVTVTRGRVKVGNKENTFAVIHPKEQLRYNKQQVKATVQRVDVSAALRWSEQDLVFDDVTVNEAARLLQDRFNIRVHFADDLIQSKRFTTIFLQGETMDQVLSRICEFNHAVYTFDKSTGTATIASIRK
ncbi:MAG TPA: FecR domain-containing protein [Flavitalea sp.]|nr:FecR domain-containing protein [Flavitalea sp.]